MGGQTIEAPVARPSRWRSLALGLTSSLTILALLGITQPKEMTGESLIRADSGAQHDNAVLRV